jgi:hypothetical protein
MTVARPARAARYGCGPQRVPRGTCCAGRGAGAWLVGQAGARRGTWWRPAAALRHSICPRQHGRSCAVLKRPRQRRLPPHPRSLAPSPRPPPPPPPVPPTFRPMPSVPGSDRGQVPNQRPDLHHFCHHGGRLPLRQADPARLQPSSPCEQRAALARVAAVAGAPPRRRRRAAAAPLRPSHRWGTGRPCQRRRRPAGHRARPPLIGGLTERRNDCIFTAQTLLEASKTGHAHIGGVPCRTA